MMKLTKAESLLSLLIVLALFSVMALSIMPWQQQQTYQAHYLFQQQQALLIAENQIDRMLSELACQTQLRHNEIPFTIRQCTPNHIQIVFPLGNLQLKKGT